MRSHPVSAHRIALIALLVLASGSLVWTPAAVAVPPGCTEVGTPERDVIAGTSRRDKLCTLGGGDYAHGGDGNDAILGGGAGDTLIGGDGKDRIYGSGGADRLFAVDDVKGDILKGGPGFDSCFGDKGDRFRTCERRFRTGTSPAVEATLEALNQALFELTVLGEELQAQVDALLEIIANLPTPTPTLPPPIRPPHPECPPTVTDESPPPCV